MARIVHKKRLGKNDIWSRFMIYWFDNRDWRSWSIWCKMKGHLWIEWEHGGSYPRSRFMFGKALLKNPECIRCGEKRFKTKKEEWDYRQKMKKQCKSQGVVW